MWFWIEQVADWLDIRAEERNELFVRKLQQCKVVFDFNDASAELQGKQVKAQTLHEMLEYITQNRGVVTEQIYPEVVNMVSTLSKQAGRFLRSSSLRTCLDPSHHRSTLLATLSIRKRTNPCWNSLGHIYKSFTNSSYALSRVQTLIPISVKSISIRALSWP